jgi:predicted site-specific integrase-resolvase
MKLSTYAKKLGITYKSAWKHYHKDLIPGAYQLPTGTIIVPDEFFDEQAQGPKKVAIYARVSSSENKNKLDAQAERLTAYCAARGYKVTKVVKEIGSGINDKRKKFLSLLADDGIDTIVVEHRDRPTRFGFAYIQTLLEKEGRQIEVINETQNDQEELRQDLILIITSFVARYYSQRRAKRKTEKIIKELQAHD